MHTPLRIAVLSIALFIIGASAANAALTSSTKCPTSGELRDKGNRCPFGFERYLDNNQCQNIRCKEHKTPCPSEEEKEKERKRCKAQGREAMTRFDGLCEVITCDDQATIIEVTCKKTVTPDTCTVIDCTDGFVYNSCKQQAICTGTTTKNCRKYIDTEGCTVELCPGEPKKRDCPTNIPTSLLKCEIIKREVGGVVVKKCEDGTYIRTRPVQDTMETPRGVKPVRRELKSGTQQ